MDKPANQNHPSEQPNQDEAVKVSPQPSPDPANVVEVGTDAAVVPGTENDAPVTVVVNPPKKSKLSTVVAIVFLVLFLIGGGCLAYWYFGVYNKPENIALDAMRQLIATPNVTTTGKISVTTPQAGHNNLSVTIEFNNASNRLPNSTTAQLSIAERDRDGEIVDNHEIAIDLGAVVMADGVIYVQVDNLQESLDRILESDKTPSDKSEAITEVVQEIIDLIEGEWWRIDIPDLISEVIDDEAAADFTEYYNCALGVANNDANYSEIASVYANNPFAVIEKSNQKSTESGETIYDVKFENDALAGFINALPYTKLAEDTYACYNEDEPYAEVVADEYEPITGTDVSKVIPEDFTFQATINNSNHKLKKLNFTTDDIAKTIIVDLGFDYSETTVSAPENYRDITELIEGIFEIGEDFLYNEEIDLDLDEFLEQTL